MGKIFVTGATGTNGKALVKKLTERKIDFVVGSRNVEKAKEVFGKEVQIRTFDFSDASTFENSLKGIDKVFLLGPPLQLKVDELIIPFLDFIKKQGINRTNSKTEKGNGGILNGLILNDSHLNGMN